MPEQFAQVAAIIIRLGNRADSALFEKFPELQWVVSATTGTDHIDLEAAKARGIEVLCLRGEVAFLETIASTAEHTWALLMSLVRRIPAAVASVNGGSWNRDTFRGTELKGKKLGVVGLGRTGSKVASYAEAFGMTVGYVDPGVVSDAHRRFSNLKDLAGWADVITLHVHLNNETEGMIEASVLESLKDGAYLINTSRGRIVDEDAVARAVESGRLAGVATDVLATELENVTLSPLLRLAANGANVIITPHIGGATWDAMHATEEFMAKKLVRAIDCSRAISGF
ncbi:NAD(P)-binding domain-containing protein [Akkermansiaceae bacterium]|nr:NAD(P)-binding domain-containing protein [Akkermansiaceae bacterium]MDB4480701.1 NAD(P)-binding domain-containing protein [Akkermansiaceae bacterium]